MKRCLNCMEEYDESRVRCPGCDYQAGGAYAGPFILEEGSILQGRYIVGTYKMVRACDITYIGWDALFERKVLIQEFFPEEYVERPDQQTICVKAGKSELYHEGINRFTNYYRSLIRLYKEKDVISVLSCFTANGTAYATMEYSSAVTLSEWLADRQNMDEGDVIYTFYQAVEAVKKVHNLGFIHGDIVLDSFWVTAAGELVLKDFAQHHFGCQDAGQESIYKAEPWIDVYGLSLLFGKIVLGREDVEEKDIKRILESKDYKFPEKTVLAIKNGIAASRGKGIRTLDEFSDRIFGDSVTMHLVQRKGAKHQGRRVNKKRAALLIGGILAILSVITVAAAVALRSGSTNTTPPVADEATPSQVRQESGAQAESAIPDLIGVVDRAAGNRKPLIKPMTTIIPEDFGERIIRVGEAAAAEAKAAKEDAEKAEAAKTEAVGNDDSGQAADADRENAPASEDNNNSNNNSNNNGNTTQSGSGNSNSSGSGNSRNGGGGSSAGGSATSGTGTGRTGTGSTGKAGSGNNNKTETTAAVQQTEAAANSPAQQTTEGSAADNGVPDSAGATGSAGPEGPAGTSDPETPDQAQTAGPTGPADSAGAAGPTEAAEPKVVDVGDPHPGSVGGPGLAGQAPTQSPADNESPQPE